MRNTWLLLLGLATALAYHSHSAYNSLYNYKYKHTTRTKHKKHHKKSQDGPQVEIEGQPIKTQQDKELEINPITLKEWLEQNVKIENEQTPMQQQNRQQTNTECEDNESIRGWLYMVHKVRTDKERTAISLKKIYLELGHGVLSIGESDSANDKMEVIKIKSIYPRLQELQKAMQNQDSPAQVNALRPAQHNLGEYYCMGVVSENTKRETRQEYFRQSLQEFSQYIRSVAAQDLSQSNQPNQHQHSYFEMMTLCHTNEDVMSKWRLFLGRLKVSCEVDYKKQSYQEAQQKQRESQEDRDDQEEAEEEGRLKEEEIQLNEKGKKSAQQLNREEYKRLEAQLQEVNASLEGETKQEERQIANQMNRMSAIQNDIQNKEEQAQCIEQALEIRQQEENNQVISLLKDEEAHAIKATVTKAQQELKKDIHTKMRKLKKRLDYQEENMLDQKDSVEDLMGNLITGALHQGSSAKCAMDPHKLYLDYDSKGQQEMAPSSDQYIEEFLTEACGAVLDNQEVAFPDDESREGGVIEQINMCTKLDYFCDKCCQFQYGYDQLRLILDCSSQCDAQVAPLIQHHNVYNVPLTNLLQKTPRKQLQAKIDSKKVINKRKRK